MMDFNIALGTKLRAEPQPESSWVHTEAGGPNDEKDYYRDVYVGQLLFGDPGCFYMDGETCIYDGQTKHGKIILENVDTGTVFAIGPEQFKADFGNSISKNARESISDMMGGAKDVKQEQSGTDPAKNMESVER